MRICALDQSTNKTGYSVFENGILADYGLLNLSNEKDIDLRLKLMSEKINVTIQNSQPNLVIFEDISQRNNVKTLIKLSRLQGMIMNICYEQDKDFLIYAPTTWRSIIGIPQGSRHKRDELKQMAVDFIQHTYGIKTSDDVAESICIGLAYLKQHNYKEI